MGYYTRFEMRIEGVDDIPEEVQAADFVFGYALTKSGEPYENVKWYDHDTDMCKLSASFPDYTFVLHGEGEESGDIWRKKYRAGRIIESKKARIVFDEVQP